MSNYIISARLAILILLLSFHQGIAQKEHLNPDELEIDNLRKQKTISLFNPYTRIKSEKFSTIHPGQEITSVKTIQSIADQFLKENKSIIGFENLNTDLMIEKIAKSPAGTHLSYHEIVAGIPVYDAQVTVSVNINGEVSFLTGNYRRHLNLQATQPSIQPDRALDLATNYLHVSGKLRGDPSTELMIFDSKDKKALLVYRVEIPSAVPFGDWEVFVDAVNGENVHVRNQIIFKAGTDGTGLIWAPDPLTAAGVYYGQGEYIDNNDQDNPSLNDQRILVTLKDLYKDDSDLYVLEGPYVKLSDKDAPSDSFPHLEYPDSFRYNRSDQNFESVMVYYNIDDSYRRLRDLGFLENDPVYGLLELEADPHGYNGLDNSYYSPQLNYCAFGEGGVDDAEDAAVIWHEYAHAIQYNISNISHDVEGETRSLLEGCADYWAASHNRRLSDFGWNHVFLWDAGIRSSAGDTTFWAGRRCDLDWAYTKEDSAQYSGTHAWGQIWSSALMKIWVALGADMTDKLFITSHYYWGMHPDFKTAAEAFIQADLDMNGGINLPVIIQWFEFHGLIDRREYQPKITHDPFHDVKSVDNRYIITCKILPSLAPLDSTNLWLIWSLDTSFSDSSLMLAGADENKFTAEIPDVTGPASINYYFYARDSLNLSSFSPSSAPVDYYALYAGPDSLLPPPYHLEITSNINVIELSWEQVVTGKYVSCNIYRSENGLDFDSINTTSESSLTDTTVFVGTKYYYYVTTVFNQWESNPSDTVQAIVESITSLTEKEELPHSYRLSQNFPNPFNPKTIIKYEIPTSDYVELSIYNILGQKVTTLVSEKQNAGYYQIEWDGARFSSGVYFYCLRTNHFTKVRKMILVR